MGGDNWGASPSTQLVRTGKDPWHAPTPLLESSRASGIRMSHVHALAATPDSLTLSWEPVQGAARYGLSWRPAGPGESLEDEEGWSTLGPAEGFEANLPPKRKGKLQPATTYAFRVRGRDAAGWMDWSPPTVIRTLPPDFEGRQLPPPTLHSADSDAITVQWPAVPGAKHYELQIRATDDCRWTTVSDQLKGTVARKRHLDPSKAFEFRARPRDFDETPPPPPSEAEQAAPAAAPQLEWFFSPASEPLTTQRVDPQLVQLLGSTFTDAAGRTLDAAAALGGTDVIGVYFSAHWCPPCRQFTPQLAQVYRQARQSGIKLQIVFVSRDHDANEFGGYLREMPWVAVPYDDARRREWLASSYQVNTIPNFKVLSKHGQLLESDGAQRLSFPNLQSWAAGNRSVQ